MNATNYTFLNIHFSEIKLARMLICQKLHLVECTFPRKSFAELTLARMYIWPNAHFPKTYFPEFTLARMYIWQNVRFSENLFSRNYISSKIHFLDTIFHLKNDTTFRLLFLINRTNF